MIKKTSGIHGKKTLMTIFFFFRYRLIFSKYCLFTTNSLQSITLVLNCFVNNVKMWYHLFSETAILLITIVNKCDLNYFYHYCIDEHKEKRDPQLGKHIQAANRTSL